MPFPDEEIPLPLVRRSTRPSAASTTDDDLAAFEAKLGRRAKRKTKRARRSSGERLRPAPAGALTGALGGLAAFGSVALLDRALAERAFSGIARLADVPVQPTAIILACLVAAASGASIGSLFAQLTSRLRRFVPLLTWSLVVFPSLVVALLAVQRTYLPRAHFLAPGPLLLASLAFAIVWSLVVLLRNRSRHDDVAHEVP